MADISYIGLALSSIKTAAEIAKLIKESSVSLEQAEVKMKLAELMSALAEAKMEIANVQDELSKKDNCIKRLEDTLNVRKKLTWESPYYWFDNEGVKEGPYCQQCWDNSAKLIRLQNMESGCWTCRTCNNTYYDKNFSKPIRKIRSDYDPLKDW